MRIQLFEHNQTAYESALSMLHAAGKAAVVHPTGTGKSFIGFKLCEDFPEKVVCWLSPSEYIFRTQLENLKATGAEVPGNIKFFTYAKLMNMSEEEMASIQPDLAIFDEFHRAGAAQWGSSVQKFLKAYPEAPVLGLSATAVRYLDNQRDMADELFDGNVASEMTLKLCDCRELFEKLNNTLTASWDVMYGYAKEYFETHGNLEVPRRYKTGDGYSLGNWIFTQRKVRGGEQYGVLGEERIAKLDRIGMLWNNARDIAWERYYDEACRYYETHGDLLVSVNDNNRNGVSLDRWIAILRSYRKRGIKTSYLTLSRIALLDSIGMVWDAPDYQWTKNYSAAMRYHREHGNLDTPVNYVDENGVRLGVWLDNMQRSYQGKYTVYRITDEQIEKLNELGMVWESRFSHRWEIGYAAAKAYYEANGHLDVPAIYKTESGYKLGDWICNQREKYRSGGMKSDRIERLNDIRMIWQKDNPWEVRFALAEAYYREHGNLNLPGNYNVNGICLSKWVNEQKQSYRGNRPKQPLSEEQIRRLEAIGMEWRNPNEVIWERRYHAVKDYFDKYGNIDIPKDTILSDGRSIGTWLTAQRRNYKKGKLTDEQKVKLDAVGAVRADRHGLEGWRGA